MKTYNIGLIGCGMIGDVHAQAIAECEGAKLVAVADNDLSRAKSFGEKYSADGYGDYREMLVRDDIDAVAICTPSGLHAEEALAAIKAGKNVLLEKPMALSSKDCESIIEELNKTDLKLGIVFQSRCSDDIHYLKQQIEEGKLGRITLCDLYMKFWRDESYFKASPWRGTFAMDGGGALMNQGIHGIDLLIYLCGMPRVLGAKVKTLVHNIETEDTATAVLEFPSGALGVIEGATSANPGFDRRIEIHGSRGSAIVVDGVLNKLIIDGETLVDADVKGLAGTASNPLGMGYARHLKVYENFVLSLEENKDPIANARAGYESVSLIEKIYEVSANTK